MLLHVGNEELCQDVYKRQLQDNMSNISAETLGAVGHTVMAVLKDLDAH